MRPKACWRADDGRRAAWAGQQESRAFSQQVPCPGGVGLSGLRLHGASLARVGVARVPVTGSQIRIVPCWPPVASQVLSGAIATAYTVPVWRVRL